ncbi:MAG: branched-chain amino acid ABC transporter permease [Betaproteobacteria bacterium]|nr:MAG: branched-chain amino acid ABC transporter permease [Betaproteobacteria bacterium]
MLIDAAFDIVSFTSFVVLVVLGLGIIASMMGIFNFAHGEFVLLGAYTVYLFDVWDLPIWLGMAVAPFAVALIGLILERTIIHRFYAAPIIAMLGTYAIGVMIRESVRGLIGGLYYSVPEPLPGQISIGEISVSKWRLIVILITVIVVYGSYWLLKRTSLGLRIRASLENPGLARSSRISTGRIYALTFTFGAALAGLAGALMVPAFSLNADLGVRFLIQGFLAIMLGGVGTFEGPIGGAAIIGVTTAGFPWVMNPVLADIMVFVLAIIAVRFRPTGLFIKRRV